MNDVEGYDAEVCDTLRKIGHDLIRRVDFDEMFGPMVECAKCGMLDRRKGNDPCANCGFLDTYRRFLEVWESASGLRSDVEQQKKGWRTKRRHGGRRCKRRQHRG